MKNKWTTLALLVISVWTGSSLAAGRTLPEWLGDALFWQQLDWYQAPSSAIWQDRGWVSYLGKQSGNTSHDRIQAFKLDGIDWQATLDNKVDGQPAQQLTIYSPGEDSQADHCGNLFNWAMHHFGPPTITVDGSYRLASAAGKGAHSYTDLHYQWDLGTTRIIQECQGHNGEDGSTIFAAASLRFSALSAGHVIHPLISAKCSRSLRLNDSSDIPLKMSDIVFIIDENNGSIRRPDLVPIRVHQVTVNPQLVRFSLTLDQSNNDYQIDLPAGTLNANMSIAGVRTGQVSGQCLLTPTVTTSGKNTP
ncbi:hypothetical protein [Paludibacterium sp. B53371]|uniref:hypothetical protein n=1 Tax=Paludibacterium sp. B53371 TaxID=2806263 RepID=UPI001C041E0B|nr:hypothetical protein [Paludibacterium sp. B53371]